MSIRRSPNADVKSDWVNFFCYQCDCESDCKSGCNCQRIQLFFL